MNAPIQGHFILRCGSCQATAYVSDDGAPADRDAELVRFADERCPRGGVNCPNTSTSRTGRDGLRPSQIQQMIASIRDRSPRIKRIPLPTIAANTEGPVEIAVTWTAPLSDASYCVFTQAIVSPELADKIAMAVKLGSLTATGCVLMVSSSVDIIAGQARIHVMAVS